MGGGLKLLGTVSGGSTKSANYFDSIGANDYEFLYISMKAVYSTGTEARGGGFIRSDSLSVDTATNNIDFIITSNTSNIAYIRYVKSNNNWLFNVFGTTTTTYSIYGVAI